MSSFDMFKPVFEFNSHHRGADNNEPCDIRFGSVPNDPENPENGSSPAAIIGGNKIGGEYGAVGSQCLWIFRISYDESYLETIVSGENTFLLHSDGAGGSIVYAVYAPSQDPDFNDLGCPSSVTSATSQPPFSILGGIDADNFEAWYDQDSGDSVFCYHGATTSPINFVSFVDDTDNG